MYLAAINPPIYLIGDAIGMGMLRVPNNTTSMFQVRQQCVLHAIGQPDLVVVVKQIIDHSTLQVVLPNYPYSTINTSQYTLARAASISAPFQLDPRTRGVGIAKFCTTTLGSPDMNVVGPATFTVVPDLGTRFNITGLGITLVASVSTMPQHTPPVSWNQFASLTKLSNGVSSTTQINHLTVFGGLFKQHLDFMDYPTVTFQTGFDATSQYFKYDVSFNIDGGTPLILDDRTGDFLNFVVNDNLTSLLYFRVLVNGFSEPIFPGPFDF